MDGKRDKGTVRADKMHKAAKVQKEKSNVRFLLKTLLKNPIQKFGPLTNLSPLLFYNRLID